MNGELKEHFKTRPEYWTFSYCSPEITALGDPNGGTRHRAVRWSLPPHRDVLEEECNMPEVKPSSFDCVFPMLPLAVWSQHLHLAAHLAALTSFPKSSLPLRSPSQGGTITAAGCPKCPGLASFYRTFPCCQWAFRLASQSSSTQNQRELGLVLWGEWIYGATWDDAGDSAVHVSHCHGRSSPVPALQLRQEVIIVKRVAVSAVLSVNIHWYVAAILRLKDTFSHCVCFWNKKLFAHQQ